MKGRDKFGMILLTLFAVLALGSASLAVSLSPEVMEKLKADGTLAAYVTQMKEAQARGVDSPVIFKTQGSLAASSETYDTVHVLVILVDFTDKLYTAGYTAGTTGKFDTLLFSTGRLNPTGSMTEFYMENSYGKFCIVGDVRGWYTMPHTYSYYAGTEQGLGDFPENAQGLALDAIDAVADFVDFSDYDSWGASGGPDGYVDGIFIVHSGTGYEESGNTSEIHSHKWSLYYPLTLNGVIISDYTMEPEESYKLRTSSGSRLSPIGVFCHEYGHFIGLPDLYDIADTAGVSKGLGDWSLMATGNYNGNSKVPAHLDGYCKMMVGFVDQIDVDDNMVGAEIPQVESEPVIYRLWREGYYGNQYFLAENRQKVGFDAQLPGSGLLIYHIYGNGNNSGFPYHVALEQADGYRNLELTSGNRGDAGDPWPGSSDNRSFDDLSNPNSWAYGPDITMVSVWNISDSDSLMTANLDIRWSRPHFGLDSLIFKDGNGNGVLDAGETVQCLFYITNAWLTGNNATITVSSSNSSIAFLDSTVYKLTVPGDSGTTNNETDPIVFKISDTLTPTFDSFFVKIESNGGAFESIFGVERQIGPAQVLVVDGDRGMAYDSIYTGDLYKRKIPWDYWDMDILGSPSGIIMDKYNMVVWFTGDTASDLVAPNDITAMKHFLDNGGNLFLTGQGIAGELKTQDSVFMRDYLHARYYAGGTGSYWPYEIPVAGSPVSDGLNNIWLYNGCNQIMSWSQVVTPTADAVPAFNHPHSGTGYTGLSYSGAYKLVFLTFGYEGMYNESSSYATRDDVLGKIAEFFGDITTDVTSDDYVDVLPGSFELAQNYPNPFNPSTTISYRLHNLSGQTIPNTELKIFNLLGQEIKTLVDKRQIPGEYTVTWDGTDYNGRRVASGVYFYKLSRGADKETRKMVLLK